VQESNLLKKSSIFFISRVALSVPAYKTFTHRYHVLGNTESSEVHLVDCQVKTKNCEVQLIE
jgi:hypothetical protein